MREVHSFADLEGVLEVDSRQLLFQSQRDEGARGAREEREAVVAWLRRLDQAQERAGAVCHHEYAALDIERGKHRAG